MSADLNALFGGLKCHGVGINVRAKRWWRDDETVTVSIEFSVEGAQRQQALAVADAINEILGKDKPRAERAASQEATQSLQKTGAAADGE